MSELDLFTHVTPGHQPRAAAPENKDLLSSDLDSQLQHLLQSRFGMSEFRRGQLDILRSIAQGRDTLAVMPTGGGKSLCYQLPSLLKPGMVVVISPLIALMNDQVASLKRMGIAAGALHSGLDDDQKLSLIHI